MSREIRRVPPDWQHPTQECRHSPWAGGCDQAKANGGRCYAPLYDQDYRAAAQAWIEAFDLWRKGEHPDQDKDCAYYWEYQGPPDEECYRARAWTPDEATGYQVYETVSEGTPVSPVFDDLSALVDWLVSQGYSRRAAERFAETGWAPSMMMFNPGTGQPGMFASDIESLGLLPE